MLRPVENGGVSFQLYITVTCVKTREEQFMGASK